jgi:hypothetical protein
MSDRQQNDRADAGRADGPPTGAEGAAPSASEIVGEEQAALDARFGAHVEGPRTLGGTGTHHRPSYSDPLPAVGMQQAQADGTDGATGHRTPGAGSPEWMRDDERA